MLAATARYAAFLLVALVGPGIALQRLAGASVDPALVLPLGIALAAAAYWFSLVLGLPWLFAAVILLLNAVLLWRRMGPRAPGPPLRGAIAPAFVLMALFAVTQYPWNRVSSSGEFLLDPLVPYDTAFHVGLVHELTLGYPPQVPGVSGFPLGYHLGTDLVRAAALRWAAVDPYDQVARFDVTVFAIALLLAVRAAAARLAEAARAAAARAAAAAARSRPAACPAATACRARRPGDRAGTGGRRAARSAAPPPCRAGA